jgi:hypothetical protein
MALVPFSAFRQPLMLQTQDKLMVLGKLEK